MTAISTNCCLKNLHAARKLKWKMPTRISETNHQGSCGPLKCIHAGLGRALILRRMNPHVCQIFDTRKLVYGIEPQGSLWHASNFCWTNSMKSSQVFIEDMSVNIWEMYSCNLGEKLVGVEIKWSSIDCALASDQDTSGEALGENCLQSSSSFFGRRLIQVHVHYLTLQSM